MKPLPTGMGFLLLLLSPLLGLPVGLGAEDLIPPTRTLEGSAERPGTLTVVSEPPDLEVFLDESEIGRTPLWRMRVNPGVHRLRISDFQTDVSVEPGRAKLLSLFHGSFVEVPEEREAPKQQVSESEKPPESRKGNETSPEERERNLTPWEWQRFLNRTSPNF